MNSQSLNIEKKKEFTELFGEIELIYIWTEKLNL